MRTQISRLWNTSTTVIPIVVGTLGVVAKSIDISILQKQSYERQHNVDVHDTQRTQITRQSVDKQNANQSHKLHNKHMTFKSHDPS